MASSSTNIVPTGAASAVLKPSDPISEEAVSVEGPNFDNPLSLQQLLDSYKRIGFQANSLGKAIDIVNKMVSNLHEFMGSGLKCRLSANGDSPTNRSQKTSRKTIGPRRSEHRRSATSSSAILPT